MTVREIKFLGKKLMISMRNDGDIAIANELFLEHQYRFCDEAIKKAQNCIIDIGGHLGFFSIMAAVLNSAAKIYSFEPHSGNFELLKKNLKDNYIQNVFPKQLAVSSEIGQTDLKLSKEDLNHSLKLAIEPTGEIQKIQTTTLARIFEKNGIMACDLLKLDCEGSEFDIIYSAPKEIFQNIKNIFLEYHEWTGENSDKLKSYIQNLGYKVQKFPNSKMRELGFLWCSK